MCTGTLGMCISPTDQSPGHEAEEAPRRAAVLKAAPPIARRLRARLEAHAWQSVRHATRRLLGPALASPRLRASLNRLYGSLSLEGKGWVHACLAKTFAGAPREAVARGADGLWTVDFLGRRIILPLRAAELGVDWDDALSILGAETEIKRTYAELLRSRARPDLFVDGGASYGTTRSCTWRTAFRPRRSSRTRVVTRPSACSRP